MGPTTPDELPVADGGGAARLSETARRRETARLLARARDAIGRERESWENEVVRLNMVVASDVARRYRGRGIAAEDLDQVAFLGLVKAARAFDPAVGEEFLSYAVPTVRGELRRHFRDAGWTVRPPRSVQEMQSRVTQAEAELCQRLHRSPRPSEIARHLEIPLSMVIDAINAVGLFNPVSLDAPRSEVRADTVADRLGEVDPAFDTTEARLSVLPLVRELTERERLILELRFFRHWTQGEIGAELGVSQEHVSRLLARTLTRLRRGLALDEVA